MTNATKFEKIFGIYATELWSMTETEFLIWLNNTYKSRALPFVIKHDDVYSPLSERIIDTGECPVCGYLCDEDDFSWGEPFCPHCGQELIWHTEGVKVEFD